MISTLTLFIVLTASVSSQVSRIPHILPNTSDQNIAMVDQTYMDDCKAVLQAKDYLYGDSTTWKTTYSNWENTNSSGSVRLYEKSNNHYYHSYWDSLTMTKESSQKFGITTLQLGVEAGPLT